MNKVEWKDVAGYPVYEVSSDGVVRNRKTGRLLRYGRNKKGYLRVGLRRDGVQKCIPVHHLVAYSFFGPRPCDFQINHIDGVKTNNSVSNLEYVTASGNLLHAYRLGLRKIASHGVGMRGHNPLVSKLSEVEVKAVCRLLSEGIRQRYIAGFFGVARETISSIKQGISWKHLPEVQALRLR